MVSQIFQDNVDNVIRFDKSIIAVSSEFLYIRKVFSVPMQSFVHSQRRTGDIVHPWVTLVEIYRFPDKTFSN